MVDILKYIVLIIMVAGPQNLLAEANEKDPWEGFNRGVFKFNDTLDRYVLRPVAKGYDRVLPDPVQDGIGNFFSNLGDLVTVFNGLLQGKFGQAGLDSTRFLINTTVGFFGFIDIGSRIGLDKHDEDFGQTLGFWGVSSGPYLVLPFFGPSTLRDAGGIIPDFYLSSYYDIGDQEVRYGLLALEVVDMRAGLLSVDALITGDRYTFIRDAYLQRRAFLVSDGQVSDAFLEDDLDEEFLFDEEL